MSKEFYAVQHGDNYDWDYGSNDYVKALSMAIDMADDPKYDGQAIRIAVIDVDDSFCTDEEIIREGSN